ncbi:MAG: TRAP transporter small permease [Pseudorhodoplanes sp.]|nr:TRAP transporter small permease [Pseudorhodoplanes sp.]
MTSFVTTVGRVLHLCEGLALKLSAFLMIALLALMNVEIAMRYVFGKSTLLADEYGGYFYAWIVLLGAVHLLRSDKYLTVTLLTNRLSPSGRNAAALFAGIVGLAVSLISLASTWSIVEMSWMFGSRSIQPSATPLLYPQLAMLLGYGLLSLAYVEEIVRRLLGMPPRRSDDDPETYGIGDIS